MDVNTKAQDAQTNASMLRTMTRTVYSNQKQRIQLGNRIAANFRSKLGQSAGMSEEEMEKEAVKILDELRLSYARITDGIVTKYEGTTKLPTEKQFNPDGLITSYGELLLVDTYMEFLRSEERAFKGLEKVLKHHPIYAEYLKDVHGIGPAMAAVLISEIDITKARYPSSVIAYAGLDVVNTFVYENDRKEKKYLTQEEVIALSSKQYNSEELPVAEGKYRIQEVSEARGRKKHHLKKQEYTTADKKQAVRDSLGYNPFLRTKLLGVLGPSFIKSSAKTVDGVRMGKARILELAKDNGFDPKDVSAEDLNNTLYSFLQAKGYEIADAGSPYAKVYYDYKNRLNNHPKHKDKTMAHKHAMAIRYCVSRFLEDYYKHAKRALGLVGVNTYAEGKLGIVHGEASSGKL